MYSYINQFTNICFYIFHLFVSIIYLILPHNNNFNSKIWDYKISFFKEIYDWIIFLLIIFLPFFISIFFNLKKKYFFKLQKIAVFSNFISLLILSLSFIQFFLLEKSKITNILIYTPFIAFFFLAIDKKNNIFKIRNFFKINLILLLLVSFVFSPLELRVNILKNIDYKIIFSVIYSLIFFTIFLFLFNSKFKFFINLKIYYLLSFIASVLFVDISLGLDILHAIPWVAPSIQANENGYYIGTNVFGQYGYLTTLIYFFIKKLFYNVDYFYLFSLYSRITSILFYFIISIIFVNILKNNKTLSLIFFLIFLCIYSSILPSSSLLYFPSLSAMRFFPIILNLLILIKYSNNYKLISFFIFFSFLYSLESFLWCSLITIFFLTYRFFIREITLKNFINFFKTCLILNFVLYIILNICYYIITKSIFNYFGYVEMITGYKSGWSVPSIQNYYLFFVFMLFYFACIAPISHNLYRIIFKTEKLKITNTDFQKILVLLLLSLILFTTYFLARSIPNLLHIAIIPLFLILANFLGNLNILIKFKKEIIIITFFMIFPLSNFFYKTFFTNLNSGLNLFRECLISKKCNPSYFKKIYTQINTQNFKYNELLSNHKKDLSEIEFLLKKNEILFTEKIGYLASYDLNPISLLAKTYINKDFFNITFNFIDELSPSIKNTHFDELKQIDQSDLKLIVYKNHKKLQRLEKEMFDYIKKNNSICLVDDSLNYELYIINDSC